MLSKLKYKIASKQKNTLIGVLFNLPLVLFNLPSLPHHFKEKAVKLEMESYLLPVSDKQFGMLNRSKHDHIQDSCSL